MYKLSIRSEARLSGVDLVLIDIVKEAIKTSPFDFGIPREGGYRSAEDQHILFLKGASKCDGYKHKSYHQSGKAFDIYGYVDGKATWNVLILTEIARHLQKVAKDEFCIELEWGGDWVNFSDKPHFQIR
jgi:peptidoglycan L-alanyl-D-glutamate endopeptidase CwlK